MNILRKVLGQERRFKQALGLCFMVWAILAGFVHAAHLQSLSIQEKKDETALVFMFSEATSHRVFTLSNPYRVVVDLQNTILAFDSRKLPLPNQAVKLLRFGQPAPGILRLVFEMQSQGKLRVDPWRASPPSAYAFMISLSKGPIALPALLPSVAVKPRVAPRPMLGQKAPRPPLQKKPAMSPKTQAPTQARQALKTAPVLSQPARPRGLRDVIVVLDPGHGGEDPGAIGSHQAREKNVTLAIALKLKQLIDKQAGMKAVLTRTNDVYIGLRERLKIARKYNADIFISIHADAFINKQSNGASVFALSQGGATSEAARWLAEKENYSELGGVNLRGLDDDSGLVRTVLIDLSQTATIAASLHMGQNVLAQLNHITSLHNHKVEQARFMVLKSPDIPSILIETGFISNPREEANLTSASYQARLTQSIFQGLKQYFREYPPHGTRIEAGLA